MWRRHCHQKVKHVHDVVISFPFIPLTEINWSHSNASTVKVWSHNLRPQIVFTLQLKLQSKFLFRFVWNNWADISNWLYNHLAGSRAHFLLHLRAFRWRTNPQLYTTSGTAHVVFLVMNSSCCVWVFCVSVFSTRLSGKAKGDMWSL